MKILFVSNQECNQKCNQKCNQENLCLSLGAIAIEAGHTLYCAQGTTKATDMLLSENSEIVVLDSALDEVFCAASSDSSNTLGSFAFCAALRKENPSLRIVMLLEDADILNKKNALNSGADDYLVMPIDAEELMLRIELLFKRDAMAKVVETNAASACSQNALQGQTDCICVGELVINPRRYEVAVRGKKVVLTPKEFQILALMAQSPGKVFTKDDFVKALWGENYDPKQVSIPVYIRRIRMKIEVDPSKPEYIQTFWSFGYRLGN